jgi:mannose-6-phosphate isomerase-like protein (cupin superfamily)
MLIKSTAEVAAFTANDGCEIREVLHPVAERLPLPYSLAVAEVVGFGKTYRHRLRYAEVYYMLEGRGLLHIDLEQQVVQPGDAIYIPADSEQWIENLEAARLRFVALVSPPWTAACDQRL